MLFDNTNHHPWICEFCGFRVNYNGPDPDSSVMCCDTRKLKEFKEAKFVEYNPKIHAEASVCVNNPSQRFISWITTVISKVKK